MRFIVINLVTAALLVFSAATAGAASFTATNDGASILVGESVTITLTLDASDFAGNTSLGFAISIGIDGGAFAVTGGTQMDPIFGFDIGGGTFIGGLPVLSPLPPNNSLDPNVVRMGVWGAAAPVGGLQWADGAFTASVTLQATAPGVFDLNPFFAPGDGFELGGTAANPIQVEGGVGLFGTTVTVVPEPGTALLMGLGLAGLSAAGRRRA